MDFAAKLASLQKTANAVASRTNDSNDRRRNRDEESSPAAAGHARFQPRPRIESDDQAAADSLDAMIRFGYRVPPYARPQPSSYTRPLHIALLAITIDELPYEHIWKEWATTTTQQTDDTLTDATIHVSLLCHAKFPDKIQSEWLKQRLLLKRRRIGRGNSFAQPEPLSFEPEWGSVEITRAMIELVSEGLRISRENRDDERYSTKRYLIGDSAPDHLPPVDKFIFISETCLPVTTLNESSQALFGDATKSETDNSVTYSACDSSWINARNRNSPNTPKNKYERDQFNQIHRMLPQHFRWKADQWCALSRSHAEAVVRMDQHLREKDKLWNSFAHINASDEMYFPTCLAILRILKQDDDASPEVQKRPVSYTEWSEGMRNPACFNGGLKDFQKVARLARKQGSLFARKFSPYQIIPGEEPVVTGQISVEEWTEEIRVLEAENQVAKAS